MLPEMCYIYYTSMKNINKIILFFVFVVLILAVLAVNRTNKANGVDSASVDIQISALNDQIARLTAENTTLKAKLNPTTTPTIQSTTPDVVEPQISVVSDAGSPAKKLVQLSSSVETEKVLMGIIDIKSRNSDVTLRSLKFNLYTTSATSTISPATVFIDLKIKAGNLVYTSDNVPMVSGGVVSFSNLVVSLPVDQTVPVSVYATIAKDAGHAFDGVTAYMTLNADMTNVVADDTDSDTVAVVGSKNILSSTTFTSGLALLSDLVSSVTVPTVHATSTKAAFNFTITASDRDIFLSDTTSILLSTTTTGSGLNASLGTIVANPVKLSGDLDGVYFVVPSGSSRTFSVNGLISGSTISATSSIGTVKITSINFGTNPINLTENHIDYELDGLQTSEVSFSSI